MKKYLNTPEEVIKALQDGKEVKTDIGHHYKMIDGVICYLFNTGTWIIGSDIGDGEKPYIEEAEPLKIEVGKFYKNRKNDKVLCIYVGEKTDFPVLFIILTSENSYRTKIDGRFCMSGTESDLDIIGEWEE